MEIASQNETVDKIIREVLCLNESNIKQYPHRPIFPCNESQISKMIVDIYNISELYKKYEVLLNNEVHYLTIPHLYYNNKPRCDLVFSFQSPKIPPELWVEIKLYWATITENGKRKNITEWSTQEYLDDIEKLKGILHNRKAFCLLVLAESEELPQERKFRNRYNAIKNKVGCQPIVSVIPITTEMFSFCQILLWYL